MVDKKLSTRRKKKKKKKETCVRRAIASAPEHLHLIV